MNKRVDFRLTYNVRKGEIFVEIEDKKKIVDVKMLRR